MRLLKLLGTLSALAVILSSYLSLEASARPPVYAHSYTIEVAPPGYPAVKLYAEETGHGPVILLLHGLGASGYTFRRIVPALSAHHRVITLDLRGFGQSEKPFDQFYSALDQAAHVRDFIERRGLRGITLAGHSFGGGVAIALALDLNRYRPGLLSRLVLMSSPAFPQPLSPAVNFLRKPVLPLLALTLIPPQITARMSLSSDMGNFAHITDRDIWSYAQPLGQPGAAHAMIATAQQIVPANIANLVRRYPTIHQPTLLVWCRRDEVVPLVTGISLKRMLPRAELKVLDSCTHAPPEEAPEELLIHMRRFLSMR